jgi:hypothetical protein
MQSWLSIVIALLMAKPLAILLALRSTQFRWEDFTGRSLTYRLEVLTVVLRATPSKAIGRVRTEFSERDKQNLLNIIRTERGEGVVRR